MEAVVFIGTLYAGIIPFGIIVLLINKGSKTIYKEAMSLQAD